MCNVNTIWPRERERERERERDEASENNGLFKEEHGSDKCYKS